ncbi:serine/threonine-protein kinase DCLK1-like [Patiria miniata]|uniref:Serine/threonine-protein kinase DCLK2 n=1 Tax=Patiria miniata TaxID=46514 RepID=A0A913ZX93_PATMI|nr:serine/threonine-protein kinase DCLK1-like [Patiria miniata]XP_038055672.1 serine/threonine-protein kinase DCLK1-like [Patiria miniata]
MADLSLSMAEFEHFRPQAERKHHLRNGLPSPCHSAHNLLLRTSLQKRTLEKKAKKVRFYRNGDRFFKGIVYAVSPERFRTFESLLADLTRTLSDKSHLPQGVRQILSIDGSRKISNLDQLEAGESYVCSSIEVFKRIDYMKNSDPSWRVGIVAKKDKDVAGAGRDSSTPMPRTTEGLIEDHRDFIKPKLVTIIKSGAKPRKAVRILLNKKTAHSFDQVLTDITEAIKLDSGAVRKLYTLDGRQITCLQDFFKDDDVFIAYGQERYSHDDFDIAVEECKMVSPYRNTKRKDRVMMKSPGTPRRMSSPKPVVPRPEVPFYPSSASPKPSTAMSLRPVIAPKPSLHKLQNATENGARPSSVASSKSKGSRRGSGTSTSTAGTGQDHDLSPHEDNGMDDGEGALYQKYEVGRVIGDGNFAVVKECLNRGTKMEFALKIINKRKCVGKEKMIQNEVSILRQVQHPNIIQLIEEFDTPSELFLVMELVKGGDLFDAITSATKYTERDGGCMVHNLFSALKYLHSMNVVHRDIKPENLLVCEHEDGTKSLKLGDFGLATKVTGPLRTVCGTPTYVAPEIILETGYGLKVDVWAAGVITYILLCGFPPFRSESNDQEELFDHIIAGDFQFISPYWDSISEVAKDLISCMLEVDVEKRFSAAQVMEHPWVASDDGGVQQQIDVSGELNTHFKIKPKQSIKAAGIALIASTALDKDGKYFQGRRPREGADGAEHTPDDDEYTY